MSAREELFEGLTDGGWNLAPGEADSVNAMIDAYRAEVRREVLGDDLNPSSLVLDAQAYRWLADDIIATMDDPDRWGADETEQVILSRYVKWLAAGKPPRDDEWDGDEPPAGETTQPADFFQPGRTYQRRRWTFHCRNVSTAPTPKAGLCAIGFLTRTDGTCTVHVLGPDHWASEGWFDVTETEQPTTPADRLPHLGTGTGEAL